MKPVTRYHADWRLIFFLIFITGVSTILSISSSQTIGTYFYWTVLILFLIFFLLLKRNYWGVFLVLISALASAGVFQAGIIIGYRTWFYTTILTAIFLTLKIGISYFSMPGFRWWFLLLALGAVHLPFIEGELAFKYSNAMIKHIAIGLSAFAIAYELSELREYREAISQMTFLIMSVCTISLFIPFYLSQEERLGTGIGMDANGVGITAVYALFSGLLYILFNKGKGNVFIVSLMVLFISVILVQTGSRQSVSISILMMGLFFILSFRRKISFQYLILITSIFISLSVFVSATEISYLDKRFNKAFGTEGKKHSIDHLKVSLYMAADHPFGLGGGGFSDNFYEYKYKAGIKSPYTNVHPHSMFAMVLADWGIPGILLLLGGFISLSRYIIKLKGEIFIIKALAIFVYFVLANAGMVFPAIFLSFLGMRAFSKRENLQFKRITR